MSAQLPALGRTELLLTSCLVFILPMLEISFAHLFPVHPVLRLKMWSFNSQEHAFGSNSHQLSEESFFLKGSLKYLGWHRHCFPLSRFPSSTEPLQDPCHCKQSHSGPLPSCPILRWLKLTDSCSRWEVAVSTSKVQCHLLLVQALPVLVRPPPPVLVPLPPHECHQHCQRRAHRLCCCWHHVAGATACVSTPESWPGSPLLSEVEAGVGARSFCCYLLKPQSVGR